MCFNTAMGQPILVNSTELGNTTSPSELVRVSYNGAECFIQLFYDEGSQITLLNPQCAPFYAIQGSPLVPFILFWFCQKILKLG